MSIQELSNTGLQSRLKEARKRRRDVIAKIEEDRARPVSLADFRQFVDRYVTERGEIYERKLGMRHMGIADPAAAQGKALPAAGLSIDLKTNAALEHEGYLMPVSSASWDRLEKSGIAGMFGAGSGPNDCTDVFGAMCFFFPVVVADKLFAKISDAAGANWPDVEPLQVRAERHEAIKAEAAQIAPEIRELEAEITRREKAATKTAQGD
ncbi:hypothetical protein CKO44_01140 [Rubrivivax gelatinosus]|uniref:hypothetical protein n=1 Tax=Rubrivivax gelatinosus TaxID=28068 RepID=UPI001904F88F|nr:hypothetical protein [Rubrivivax gelatinosus]MBK1612076.1 hypothetical protein [Rubrivivax gelatinosus]MBZ8143643.1 hypothetical protein [Rubrivivax gelatinosus]